MKIEARLAQHDALLDQHEATLELLQNEVEVEQAGRHEVQETSAQTEPLVELEPIYTVWDRAQGRAADPDSFEAEQARRHRRRQGLEASEPSSSTSGSSVATPRGSIVPEMGSAPAPARGRPWVEMRER